MLDAERRRPTFERYVVVQERVPSTDFLYFGKRPPGRFLVDPDSPEHEGLRRGLSFLGFVGDGS